MYAMFSVRSARAPAPIALSWALPPMHAACVSPPPIACPRLSARQAASAFNQLLRFDTSKVTTWGMWGMFAVRSARALAPQS